MKGQSTTELHLLYIKIFTFSKCCTTSACKCLFTNKRYYLSINMLLTRRKVILNLLCLKNTVISNTSHMDVIIYSVWRTGPTTSTNHVEGQLDMSKYCQVVQVLEVAQLGSLLASFWPGHLILWFHPWKLVPNWHGTVLMHLFQQQSVVCKSLVQQNALFYWCIKTGHLSY